MLRDICTTKTTSDTIDAFSDVDALKTPEMAQLIAIVVYKLLSFFRNFFPIHSWTWEHSQLKFCSSISISTPKARSGKRTSSPCISTLYKQNASKNELSILVCTFVGYHSIGYVRYIRIPNAYSINIHI